MSANVQQAIPFFQVTDLVASLEFYVNGLGFTLERQWIPEGDEHYPSDGRIRWCMLRLGDTTIMLQEFVPHLKPAGALGTGASIVFRCADALALHRAFKSRGLSTLGRPAVGNGLWVVRLADPDGYRIDFSSPTDAPEDSELED